MTMNYRTIAISLLIPLLFPIAGSLCAQAEPADEAGPFPPFKAGIRIGTSVESKSDLNSYELFGTLGSPWNWNLTETLSLHLEFEGAVGTLTGEGETAGYLRISPLLELSSTRCPVSLVIGSGPSWQTEDTFGHLDMGSDLQFTSSIGLEWQVSDEWAIGYRFQHSSNGSLSTPNPGLEMHSLSLSYAF